jgi:hypothetical protein
METRGSRNLGISSTLGLFSLVLFQPLCGDHIQKLFSKALFCTAPQRNLEFESSQSNSISTLVSYNVNTVVKLMFKCAAP